VKVDTEGPGPAPTHTCIMNELLATARDKYEAYLTTSAYLDFSAPLRGRTVAVVGPAAYVVGANIASHVERADVVVRPNVRVDGRGKLVLPKGTTSRVDIVYHSGAVLGERVGLGAKKDIATSFSALSMHTLKAYEAHGVRTLVVAVCGNSPRVQNLVNLSHHFSSDHMRVILGPGARHESTGCSRPTERFRTGMKALVDVHRQRPAAIFLFGFDHYAGGSLHSNGFPGYYRDVVHEAPASALYHNTTQEKEHMARLILAIDRRGRLPEAPSTRLYVDEHEASILRPSVLAVCAQLHNHKPPCRATQALLRLRRQTVGAMPHGQVEAQQQQGRARGSARPRVELTQGRAKGIAVQRAAGQGRGHAASKHSG